MATIAEFIDKAKGHSTGAKDQRVRLLEMQPDVLETETGDIFFLTPVQRSLFQGAADTFNFDKWSFRQYCERIAPHEAPMEAKYVHACGATLGLQQLKFWNEVNRDREGYLRLRVEENGRTTVRAFLSGLYQPIDAAPVATHLQGLLPADQVIEFSITDLYWSLTFWQHLPTDKRSYHVGFRVMGSEIGAMRHVRCDVLLRFVFRGADVSLPLLINKQPLAAIPYSNAGSQALNRLDRSLQKGVQAADEATEAVERRKQQTLKYPVDEFHELVVAKGLPSNLKSLPVEAPQRFEKIATKFDLACLLGDIAAETRGRAKLRIEAAAGIYLLTGRIRLNNRNYDGDENA
jgi:hypothetical protein